MYLIVKRTVNRVADWVLKNDIDNVQTLISSKKKTCIDLLFQFRMLLVYFYFLYNSIKYESSSLEDEKIIYVQRQIFQTTFHTCLLHFRILFVYVWFLK